MLNPLIYIQAYETYSHVTEKDLHLLNTQELERYQKYIYPKDRIKFLQRHYCLYQILHDISMSYLILEYNELGQPKLKNGNEILEISISSSENFFVIAVFNSIIGVDIQKEHPLSLDPQLIAMILHPNELKLYKQNQKYTERLNYFYKVWTKKEAYTKALGKGLLIDFSSLDTTVQSCTSHFILPTVSQFAALRTLPYHIALSTPFNQPYN
jgi:4'-phosphopantetheinyl transferase